MHGVGLKVSQRNLIIHSFSGTWILHFVFAHFGIEWHPKVSGLDCVGWVFGRLECDNWLDFVSLGYSAFIGPYASKCDLTNSRGDLTLVTLVYLVPCSYI